MAGVPRDDHVQGGRGSRRPEALAAMEGFAKALRMIPTIICENAGLDSSEIVSQLRASHGRGDHKMGVDILTGETGDMEQCGITECFRVKQHVLL